MKKWYGFSWMSCFQMSKYQVHQFGPYHWKWWAWIRAKLSAIDLQISFPGEESGIYYCISTNENAIQRSAGIGH